MSAYPGWVWPLERHPRDNRLPVISDGFSRTSRGGNGHYGVDIMYRRQAPAEPRLPDQTKLFELPSGIVRVLAAGQGTVWQVNLEDPHGISCRIDHHTIPGQGPRITAYRHLAVCVVKVGQAVRSGEQIGIAGYDKTMSAHSTPNHLHFEVWDMSAPQAIQTHEERKRFGIDPAPVLVGLPCVGRDGSLMFHSTGPTGPGHGGSNPNIFGDDDPLVRDVESYDGAAAGAIIGGFLLR